MTELYDDCNHLNKTESWYDKQHRAMETKWKKDMVEFGMAGERKILTGGDPATGNTSTFIQIGDAWYSLAALDAEKRLMKAASDYNKMRLWPDTPGAQFAQMQDELCTCNRPKMDPAEFKSNMD